MNHIIGALQQKMPPVPYPLNPALA